MKKNILLSTITIILILLIGIGLLFFVHDNSKPELKTPDFKFTTIDLKTDGDIIFYDGEIQNDSGQMKRIETITLNFMYGEKTLATTDNVINREIQSKEKIKIGGEIKGTLKGQKAETIKVKIN